MSDAEIARLRRVIDTLDTEIVALVEARARIAIELGQVKRADGRALRDAPREAEILSRLALGLTVVTPADLAPVYRALMGMCLDVQTRALATPPDVAVGSQATVETHPAPGVKCPPSSARPRS